MKRRASGNHCLQCGGVALTECHFCGDCNYVRAHKNGRREAATAVAKAIKEGKLRPAKEFACVDCGIPAREYDHRDYSQPLQVEPVCARCNCKRGPGKWVRYKTVRELLHELSMTAT